MHRAVFVEDDLDIAEILRQSFAPEGFECRIASCALSAIKLIDKFQPHVIILDILIPRGSGHRVLKHLKKIKSPSIILTISGSDTVQGAELYELMAHGFFRKPFESHEILAAAKRFLKTTEIDFTRKPTLTIRESEILKLVSYGLSSQEIATKLQISVRTVEHHRNNLRTKLGAKNTAELIKKALPFVS